MAETVSLDRGPWPTAYGSPLNDRTSPVALTGRGVLRWRVALPARGIGSITVGADGWVFVTSGSTLTAITRQGVRWSAPTLGLGGTVLLADGRLAASDADGLVLHDRRDGQVVARTPAPLLCVPNVSAHGQVVFVRARTFTDAELCAVGPDLEPVWSAPLSHWSTAPPLCLPDRVIVEDGEQVSAFTPDGRRVWSARRDRSDDPVPRYPPPSAERARDQIAGPPVALGDGRVFVRFEGYSAHALLLIDAADGGVRRLDAHLPLHRAVVPLRRGGRTLLATEGPYVRNERREFRPRLVFVDAATGAVEFERHLPVTPAIVAGANGRIALAGSPSSDRWDKYHPWPLHDRALEAECYVKFFDAGSLVGQWRPDGPITGPLAVGTQGDLLVPVDGTLCSIG